MRAGGVKEETGSLSQHVASDGEMFEVLSPNGDSVLGLEQRLRVHTEGLLHAAVHVLVWNATTTRRTLLVQRRAAGKRIAPCMWDLSCAEHLQPGETQAKAAVRGLKEELNLEVEESQLRLLRDVQLFRRHYKYQAGDTERCYQDNEFIALYAVTLSDFSSLKLQEEEVSEIKWIDRDALLEDMLSASCYTPWFLDERPWL